MKKRTFPFLILCLLFAVTVPLRSESPEPDAALIQAEARILLPFRQSSAPEQMYSRRILLPLRLVWGASVSEKLQAFTVYPSEGNPVLGLWDRTTDSVYHFDPESMRYVLQDLPDTEKSAT